MPIYCFAYAMGLGCVGVASTLERNRGGWRERAVGLILWVGQKIIFLRERSYLYVDLTVSLRAVVPIDSCC